MADRVSVRMYRVGFGDCFLLRFWTGDQATRVLVDCGSITEGQAQVDRVVKDVIETCRDGDGVPRIALVVATHRHRDHVGGFSNPAWGQVQVGEVWMPWTEDPDDERATYIRNRQSALALSLAPKDHDADPLALAPPGELGPKAQAQAQAQALGAMALNALTNEKAMATLHGGFAGRVKPVFLPLKDVVCEARAVAGLNGVQVHVLGPPRDEKAMAIMDPPAGAGYLAAGGTAGAGGEAFGARWRLDEAAYRAASPDSTFSTKDLLAVNRNAEQPAGELAAALDSAVNNTSLILIFEVAGQYMLFPADAQWGSWNAALQEPRSRALLAKASFYKVGHHGSHNATPKELIAELMPAHFTAMFSTCHVPQWPDIPRGPLVAAIAEKAARYARSDEEDAARAAGFKVETGLYVECDIPLAATAEPAAPAARRTGKARRKPAHR